MGSYREHYNSGDKLEAITGINLDGTVCISVVNSDGELEGVTVPAKTFKELAKEYLISWGYTLVGREGESEEPSFLK